MEWNLRISLISSATFGFNYRGTSFSPEICNLAAEAAFSLFKSPSSLAAFGRGLEANGIFSSKLIGLSSGRRRLVTAIYYSGGGEATSVKKGAG